MLVILWRSSVRSDDNEAGDSNRTLLVISSSQTKLPLHEIPPNSTNEEPRVRSITSQMHRIIRSATIRNTLWLGSSNVSVLLLNAIGTAVFVRVMGVTEFGVYTLILSLMNLFIDLADVGLGASIVRFGSESIATGNDARTQNVFTVYVRSKLVLAAVTLVGAWLFSSTILQYTFHNVDSRLTSFFHLTLLSIVANIAANFFTPFFHSYRRFSTAAILSTVRTAIKFVLILGGVFLLRSFTISIAIWIEIVAAAALAAMSFFASPWKSFALRVTEPALPREIFHFTKWMSLHTLFFIVSSRVDVFAVGALLDPYTLGLYGAASRLASILLVLAGAYWTVLITDISGVRTVTEAGRKMKLAFAMVALILLGIVAAAALGSPLVRVFFGASFLASASAFQMMCIGVAFLVLCYPTNAILFAMKKTALFPLTSAISILFFIVANQLLIPRYGMIGGAVSYALNGVVTYLISVTFYFITTRRGIKLSIEAEPDSPSIDEQGSNASSAS